MKSTQQIVREGRKEMSKTEQQRRRDLIANGLWNGRPAVFKSKKDYDRKRAAKETRKQIEEG